MGVGIMTNADASPNRLLEGVGGGGCTHYDRIVAMANGSPE